MSHLEIIHLRTSGEPLASLGQRICDSLTAELESFDLVTIYRREGLETDVAIHIRRQHPSSGAKATALGLRLAAALKAYGLVEHTMWEELIDGHD